ncbi:MAG: universal stress protein [Rhodospirillales bacterium]|nr:universal stress protein [Rhodospirillales bacterium]
MTNILLASEGRPFSKAAITQAGVMAGAEGKIHVISIARIWGVSLGFPNPWLLPSKQEWAQQRTHIADAIAALKNLGHDATGVVAATRAPSKRINAEATRLNCEAIVMGSDPRRHWLLSDLYWSQEPYRVKKRARRPVELVIGPELPRRSGF